MRQTLIDIQALYSEAAGRGEEPSPDELAAVIERRMRLVERGKYLRGLGAFIGQALHGGVPIPGRWEPPE